MDKREAYRKALAEAVRQYKAERFHGLETCVRNRNGLREATIPPTYGKLKG